MRLFLFIFMIFFFFICLLAFGVTNPVVWLSAFLAFIGWHIFTYKRERRTRETSLQEIAFSLGLSYLPSGRVRLSENEDFSSGAPFWRFYSYLRRQKVPDAKDIMSGRFKNHEVMACVVHGVENVVYTYFKLKHQGGYPQVVICDKRRMGLRGPKKWTGYIVFGPDSLAQKFSKAFRVYSSDESFARSICHASMMKYLLALRDDLGRNIEIIEILAHSISLQEDGYHIDKAERRLNQLVEIYSLLPQAS